MSAEEYENASFVKRQVTFTFYTPHSANCLESDYEKCNDGDKDRIFDEMTMATVASRMLGMDEIVEITTQSSFVADPIEYAKAKAQAIEVDNRVDRILGNVPSSDHTHTNNVQIPDFENMPDDQFRKLFDL